MKTFHPHLLPHSCSILFCSFLIFVFTVLSASSHAESPGTLPTATPEIQNELQNIDQEIDFLNKDLEKARKNALNQEIHAQQFMFDNWHEFSENVGQAETNEKQILEIKKKIKALTERKESLKNSSNQP
jgi:chromosome segregation ATPase